MCSVNRHELPPTKPLYGTVYVRHDPRVIGDQPLHIRGIPNYAQILEHVPSSERSLLEATHLTIDDLLSTGGAISSDGQILHPQINQEPHPPFKKYLRTQFVQKFGMDVSNPRSAHLYVYVWTEHLKDRYFGRRFSADSVQPIAISEDGSWISLEPLVRAFAAFIRLQYAKISLDPSINPKGVARCFIVETLEKFHEEMLQRTDSLQ